MSSVPFSSPVSPQLIIPGARTFDGSPVSDHRCDVCESADAIFWCTDCELFFCSKNNCNRTYHEPKKFAGHQRILVRQELQTQVRPPSARPMSPAARVTAPPPAASVTFPASTPTVVPAASAAPESISGYSSPIPQPVGSPSSLAARLEAALAYSAAIPAKAISQPSVGAAIPQSAAASSAVSASAASGESPSPNVSGRGSGNNSNNASKAVSRVNSFNTAYKSGNGTPTLISTGPVFPTQSPITALQSKVRTPQAAAGSTTPKPPAKKPAQSPKKKKVIRNARGEIIKMPKNHQSPFSSPPTPKPNHDNANQHNSQSHHNQQQQHNHNHHQQHHGHGTHLHPHSHGHGHGHGSHSHPHSNAHSHPHHPHPPAHPHSPAPPASSAAAPSISAARTPIGVQSPSGALSPRVSSPAASLGRGSIVLPASSDPIFKFLQMTASIAFDTDHSIPAANPTTTVKSDTATPTSSQPTSNVSLQSIAQPPAQAPESLPARSIPAASSSPPPAAASASPMRPAIIVSAPADNSDSDSDSEVSVPVSISAPRPPSARQPVDPSLLCQICHMRPSVVYCFECEIQYCDGAPGAPRHESCNFRVHKKRDFQSHRQVPAQQKPKFIHVVSETGTQVVPHDAELAHFTRSPVASRPTSAALTHRGSISMQSMQIAQALHEAHRESKSSAGQRPVAAAVYVIQPPTIADAPLRLPPVPGAQPAPEPVAPVLLTPIRPNTSPPVQSPAASPSAVISPSVPVPAPIPVQPIASIQSPVSNPPSAAQVSSVSQPQPQLQSPSLSQPLPLPQSPSPAPAVLSSPLSIPIPVVVTSPVASGLQPHPPLSPQPPVSPSASSPGVRRISIIRKKPAVTEAAAVPAAPLPATIAEAPIAESANEFDPSSRSVSASVSSTSSAPSSALSSLSVRSVSDVPPVIEESVNPIAVESKPLTLISQPEIPAASPIGTV